MSVRETSNLINRSESGNKYPRSQQRTVTEWIIELWEESKAKEVFTLPAQRGETLIKSPKYGYRIDCQGYFEVNGTNWLNLQIQENVLRKV